MKKLELIGKQQLEIEELKKDITIKNNALNDIISSCVCIGGPLNDNFLQFNSAQLNLFSRIYDSATGAIK